MKTICNIIYQNGFTCMRRHMSFLQARLHIAANRLSIQQKIVHANNNKHYKLRYSGRW